MGAQDRRRKPTVALIAAFALAAVALGIHGAVAVTTTAAGHAITRVKTVRSDTGASRSGTTFVTVPGAEATIFVPKGTRALILSRFSAESSCSGADTGWCALRIMVGQKEAGPASGKSFSFDWAAEDGQFEAHAVERLRGPLGPGTYRVRVQWAVTDPALSFWLDDWVLVVERVRFD